MFPNRYAWYGRSTTTEPSLYRNASSLLEKEKTSTMAAQLRSVNQTLGQMQKNLECAICLDLLQDPVSTKCDHQFCNFCILALLDKSRGSSAACPLCKESVTKRSLTSNDRLNDIVQAVRGVVQAVEEDTGFRCTPPKGPRVLSQQTKQSPSSTATAKLTESRTSPSRTKASTKISKGTRSRANKKGNLRKANPKATGSIPIYVDSDDSDTSEASTQGVVLITDFNSNQVEGIVTRKSNRKTANRKPLKPANRKPLKPANRKPLKPANQDNANKQTKSQAVPPSFKKNVRMSIPPIDTPKAGDSLPVNESFHLLQALHEGSLGILEEDSISQRGLLSGSNEQKEHIRGEDHPQDGCLLQAFDQESLGMLGELDSEGVSQENNTKAKTLGKEPDCPDRGKTTLESDGEAANIFRSNTRRNRGGEPNLQASPNPVSELHSEVCQANAHEACQKDIRLISGECKIAQNTTNLSSAEENPKDDPYEFIASQRTPRKPKPKHGRRQKHASGKASKEFDYMKWKRSEKRILAGSQAVFSQSVPAQISLGTSSKDRSFEKPSEVDAQESVDNKLASQMKEADSTGEPTNCNSLPDVDGHPTHQRITRSKLKKPDNFVPKMQSSKEENIKKKRTTNSKKDVSGDPQSTCMPTADQLTKPNVQGRQQKTKTSYQPNVKEDHSKPPEEPPPPRRLRSSVKIQSTNKEGIEDGQNQVDLEKQGETTLNSGISGGQYDDELGLNRLEMPEGQVTQKELEGGMALKEALLSSDEDDDGDYRFDEHSLHSESDGESTAVSLTDPSCEPSTEFIKSIPELFHEADSAIRQSRRTELQIVNDAAVHQRPHADETLPHGDTEDTLEVMGCSQPVVKKHSPLASAGVFGQVYKRRSLLLSKSPGEADLHRVGEKSSIGIDEKVEKMYSMGEGLCKFKGNSVEAFNNETVFESNHGNAERDKDANLENPEVDSGTPPGSISEGAISQPDLFDKDTDNVVDLTVESNAEDLSDEQRDLQSDFPDQVANGVKKKTLETEEPQRDAVPTKSDWELALELAREFDTEPRQFSLRSSRHGRLEPATKDDFIPPSRTKPELDVSVQPKRCHAGNTEEGAAIKMLRDQGDLEAVVCETSEIKKDHHCGSKKSENHTIMAGKKTLRQPQRSVSSEVTRSGIPAPKDKTKRRSSRRSSRLPTAHQDETGSDRECGGTIESYDSSIHSKTENAKGVVETADPPAPLLVESVTRHQGNAPSVNTNVWLSKSNRKEAHQSRLEESLEESNEPSVSSSLEEKHLPKRRTPHHSKKGRSQEKRATPPNKPDQNGNESLGQSSRSSGPSPRQLRSSSENEDQGIRVDVNCKPNTRKHKAVHSQEGRSVTSISTPPPSLQTDAHITDKSGLSPEVAGQHFTGPAQLITEDDRGEEQLTTEQHLEHSPRQTQSHTPSKTREQMGREDDGYGKPECEESDKTESIDLGEVEYEEENKANPHSSSAAIPLSGSDTDSIELHEDSEIRFIQLSSTELKAKTGEGLKNQQNRKGAVTQKPHQTLEEDSKAKRTNRRILTPDSTSFSKGKAAMKTKKMQEPEPAEDDDDFEVSAEQFSHGSRKLAKSNPVIRDKRLLEFDSSKSLKNTVPESIMSEISQESTPKTGLSDRCTKKNAAISTSGSPLTVRNLPSQSSSGKLKSPRCDESVKRSQKTSPKSPSLKAFEDSSLNQESEKILVPPPVHYTKTFLENSGNQDTCKSRESSLEEPLSLTPRRSRLSSKRKSCPEERTAVEMKPSSKRYRSAGAVPEIKHWVMGSKRRSKRLDRAATVLGEDINTCEEKKEPEDSLLGTESAGDISASFSIKQTEDSLYSSIQTRRKSRSLSRHGSHSTSQTSLPGSETATALKIKSSKKESFPPTVSPQQGRQFSQKYQEEDTQDLGGPKLKNSSQIALGPHSLCEQDDIEINATEKLSSSQDLHQIPKSSLQDEAHGKIANSEGFSGRSSSLFSSPKMRSAASSVKSSGGIKTRKLSLKQGIEKVKCAVESNSEKASEVGSSSLLLMDSTPNGKITNQTQSLFSENSSEHSKKEHSALSSKPSRSVESSCGTSKASLSIPFQGKPYQLVNPIGDVSEDAKQTALFGHPKLLSPSNTAKALLDNFVPASDGASVSPECLSDPIINVSHKHRLKDMTSYSPREPSKHILDSRDTSSQKENLVEGGTNKKQFSFRKASLKNKQPDINTPSPRNLNEDLPSESISCNSLASTTGSKQENWRMHTQELDIAGDSLLGASENIVSSSSSTQKAKQRKRKSSSFTAGKAKQFKNTEANHDDKHQSREDFAEKPEVGTKQDGIDSLGNLTADDNLEEFTKGEARETGGQFWDVNEEKRNEQHHSTEAEEKGDDKNCAELASQMKYDSSGDIEMVSAEEDEPQLHDDQKDISEDDNSEDDIEEDDDDVIIPPTPPCQLMINPQSRKQPAYLNHLSMSRSHGILSLKSRTSRPPKGDPDAEKSSIPHPTRSRQGAGDRRRAHQKLKAVATSQSPKLEHEKAGKKTECIQDSEDDDMMDSSFVKRFPLSSSPIRDDISDDALKDMAEKAGALSDASENSQSLSIFQAGVAEDISRGEFRRSLRKETRRKDQESIAEEENQSQDEETKFAMDPRDRCKSGENKETEASFKVGLTENGRAEAGFQDVKQDHDDEHMLERQYDTEGSSCSESNCSHHLNLTSASSVLSSQSELMNSQQQLKAQESLQKMALEIAQMEAALANDTDTQRHPDAAPAQHPSTPQDRHSENADSHADFSQQSSLMSYKRNSDDVNPASQDDPCPASDDLCTPADLFTPAELYSSDANASDLEEVCSVKVISSSHVDTAQSPHGSSNSDLQGSNEIQRSAYSKRSRPVISDDESESEEETYAAIDEVGVSGCNVDNCSLDGGLLRNCLEIPGVTTYGSDSEMSELGEPDISSGSPRSPSPPPPPRSPSPPPDLSQSTARRSSLLANLPESVKAVSRLADQIRSRRASDHPSPPKPKKHPSFSKRMTEHPPRARVSESDSSDEEQSASSPRKSLRREVQTSRPVSGQGPALGQGTSGWKSKSLEMQSDHRLMADSRRKQGIASKSSGSNDKSTPVRKPGHPRRTVLNRTLHSRETNEPFRKNGTAEKGHSPKRGDHQDDEVVAMRSDDSHEDDSHDERPPSPVIGRSLLTTPAAKKKTKPLSFVTTGLNRTDMRDVGQLTKRFGCRFASTFNACTTHVIVNTDENLVCERTLKYFQGIASKVWVVSFKWVSACLKTEELLPEEPFEVTGDVVNGPSHNGPRRARLWQGSKPLQKYDVCCVGPFTGLNKEQLVSLLELLGASTVQHPSLFPYCAGRRAVIVAQAEATDLDYDYDALYKKYRVPIISREWILDIIATYKIQPMADYVLSPSGDIQPIIDLDSDGD